MLHFLASVRVRAFVVALACAWAAPGAFAADAGSKAGTAKPAAQTSTAKPREGALGGGTSTLPPLTRDELSACLAEQDRIKQEADELARQKAQIDKDRSEIERTGAEIKALKPTVNTSDEAAVNAYNERLRQQARMIEDFKAATPAFNARVDKFNADRKANAEACADRRFFEEDYDAIKAGK